MKIGELVKLTQTSKPLIHHYLREGLLAKPRATGRNSAEYDQTHVEQLLLVKELRESYFLPLPLIKKIIKRQKKLPFAQQFSFRLENEYFRPLDRFFPRETRGRDEFGAAAGLGQKWLALMEEWRIITPQIVAGEAVYSQEEAFLGRLIVEMDRLGFGPKDGYSPDFLKKIADFLRQTLAAAVRDHLAANLDRLDEEEFKETGLNYAEVLSLFVFHLFRKILREESLRFVESLPQDDPGEGG
ncbi:MAG: MerR family transcriptional regulator [Pseudomonadota bacterium]